MKFDFKNTFFFTLYNMYKSKIPTFVLNSKLCEPSESFVNFVVKTKR